MRSFFFFSVLLRQREERRRKTLTHPPSPPLLAPLLAPLGLQFGYSLRSTTPVAVSASDDPSTGSWTTYTIASWDGGGVPGFESCTTSTPCIPDFPLIGMNEDSVVITSAMFGGAGKLGSQVIVIPSASLLTGLGYYYRAKAPGDLMSPSMPADSKAPSGGKVWLVGTNGRVVAAADDHLRHGQLGLLASAHLLFPGRPDDDRGGVGRQRAVAPAERRD